MDDEPRPLKRAELTERARQVMQKLENEGMELHPVTAKGRNLAKNFWAREWMKHLAQSETYGMRLAPGRTYLRYGCVIDLTITTGRIHALVAGENLYEVELQINPPDEEQMELIRSKSAGQISSWIDVLQGKLGESVLNVLCEKGTGILPELGNMRCSCTCPDWADLCKHCAAALYAVGVKLDDNPELLFTLRHISLEKLIPRKPHENIDAPSALPDNKLSSIFNIHLDD